jgi:alpha-L-fucosidase
MRYFWSLVLAASAALAQTYQPAPENLKAREWFQDSQCGLSIHRGIYSLLGKGE